MESSSSSSLEYVGFQERALAFLIDTALVWILVTPLFVAVYGTQYFEQQMSGEIGTTGLDAAVHLALGVLTVLLWRTLGGTPGKLSIPAKIVDARTGRPASTLRLVVRFLSYLISMAPLFLGFVWIAIDRRKQGWHDKIAGTLVIHDD